MIKKIVFFIMIIVFLLISCMSEEGGLQQEYISKAKEVSIKYGLDDASFSFKYEGEVFSIKSYKFSDLSDEQKFLYLREIDRIIENSNPRAWVMIVSGYVYQLHPDFEFAFSDSGGGLIFPYGEPTVTPEPIITPLGKVELISNTELDFLLAGESIYYLTSYEENHWSLPYETRVSLRQMYDKGHAYYISEGTIVLLLEIDGEFAKIQLIDPQGEKEADTIGWIRKNNIK